jgi:hypothetical protein
VDKILLEMYRLLVSTDFGGVLKMHFGELKKRFLPNAPIHLVWYIRNFLRFWMVVYVFFI